MLTLHQLLNTDVLDESITFTFAVYSQTLYALM